jgi:hypothetical protein
LKERSTTKITYQNSPLSRKLIDQLFLKLDGLYGHAWTSRHTNAISWEIAKNEWGNALTGIKVSWIEHALTELLNEGDQFPPSLPAFLKLCRDQRGIITEELAYHEALTRNFKDPISKLCYEKIGSWDFTHDSEKVLKKKFANAYREVVREISNQPLKALEKYE